jgi:SAM-dependent methyltransferase
MTNTYSQHAEVCTKFYELTLDAPAVADFVFEKIGGVSGQRALFVGGMFDIAASLLVKGLDMVVVDYTDEMVALGRSRLAKALVVKADLRTLPFESEFDLVFVAGRVFTHMIQNTDLIAALESCKRSLRPGGRIFADNYEISRIQKTNYFNGEVECQNEDARIVRRSTTEMISSDPFIVKWDASYQGHLYQNEFSFSDSMHHRAFSRSEFASYLSSVNLRVLQQGDNFDETSFYTTASSDHR